MRKRALLVSGGGAWGAYGCGTLQKINKNYNTVIGISTGSLLGPLASIREWERLKAAYTTVNTYDVFDGCWYKGNPLNKKGGLRKLPIIMTLVLGHKSVYTTNALRKRIDEFYPKEYHDKIQERKIDVRIGTQNFAQQPPMMHYFSSLDENHEDFKDWMWCGGSFPIYGSLIKKSWRNNEGDFHVGQWSDGGFSDLVGLDELMDEKYDEVDVILHRTKNQYNFETKSVNNLVKNINTSMHAIRYDIEFDYFYRRITKLNERGTKVTVYWLPRNLSLSSMTLNPKQMTEWWNEGFETAFDSDRVEIFEPIKRKF